MLKMSSQIETVVNAYKTLAKIPSVTGGRLNKAATRINAKWSVRALDKGKNVKYSSSYIIDNSFNVVALSDFGTDVSNELLSVVSPKETFKALIREEKTVKDVKKQYLEVWNRSTLQHCIDLTALDLHGDVYADSEFGGLDWSQDESSLVFVAERKPPKSEPYIKRKADETAKKDGSGEPAPRKGEEFVYRQDWGEQLVGKYSSVIVVCRLADETVSVLDHLPEGDCPGQVRFSGDGSAVVGVAWITEPRRLGLIFCTSRPSYIFSLTLTGEMKKLSSEGYSVRSPRFTPNGDLVWLQRLSEGPHHACHQLVCRKRDSEEVKQVIGIVQKEKDIENGTFTGVYCQSLPSRCFTEDGRLVFSTSQHTNVFCYIVNLDSGRIVNISKSKTGSLSVLDVQSNVVLASYSDLTTPGQLFVANIPPKGSESYTSWVRVSEPTSAPSIASPRYLHFSHDNTDDVKTFTAIYIGPESLAGPKVPLVVWPHGGPHSNFVDAYSVEAALFSMLGFAVLRVNFRGSTGHGDRNVRCLISNAGSYDVADCYLALTTVRESKSISDVVLYGGSYGGFVVGHLAAKSDEFKAMVMRNPLIDLATKGHYADNSDGCAVEAGFTFTEKGPLSEDELVAMRRCSPLAHVHKVRAPTALMLGSGDKRVPHYQGLEYARRLKANGVETRVYMYDDNHSLSSLPAEMDNLINGAHWFLTHLKE